VASAKVMSISKSTPDFLAGQNMFDYFIPANSYANGKVLSKYDGTINNLFQDQVKEYVNGTKSKEEALAAFKQNVEDATGVAAE
ncbi:MAG: carbohydrate ABC transporter substrate-binding protein, partial [Lachnospiraceae bacterium]|nr:carbohydrate ABC transporter substrate-binding protein [Lachnospiraceae bacterium]